MATESELRDALRGASSAAANPRPGDSGTPALDGAEVIRRARARRRPKQVAFGAVGTLAVAGFAYVGITAMPGPLAAPMSVSGGADAESYSDDGSGFGPQSEAPEREGPVGDRLSADVVNSCGEKVVTASASEVGLILTPEFPTAVSTDGEPVRGQVTLTNTSAIPVRAWTPDEPAIALSREGVTVWHSLESEMGPWISVELAPGESKEYPAEFMPVLCHDDLELTDDFSGTLPPLEAGEYQVSALMVVTPDMTAYPHDDLVGGLSQSITLR